MGGREGEGGEALRDGHTSQGKEVEGVAKDKPAEKRDRGGARRNACHGHADMQRMTMQTCLP